MRKPSLLIAGFFILVTLVFFYPVLKGYIAFPGDLLVGNYSPYKENSYGGYLPGGVPNKAQGTDVIRQLLPWKYFTIDSIKHGSLPLWNPYNFSGNPHIANFQSGVFYPLNLVFFLFPFTTAWNIFIMLQPFIAGTFLYLLLREYRLAKFSSAFGAFTFAFSSYMVVWIEWGNVGHTFLWLPLILYCIERMVKKITVSSMIGMIAAFTLSILAGYIQGYFYIVLVAIAYFLARSIQEKKFSLPLVFHFFLALVFPLLLSSLQLLPTIELFSLSARNNYSFSKIETMLNPIWYGITILIPDFFGNPASRNSWFPELTYIEKVSYIGFVPFVFAFYSLFHLRERKQLYIFFGISVISFLLATNLFFTQYFYLIPIPFLSTTVPTRILSVCQFAMCVMAGFGFDLFFQSREKKRFLLPFLVIGGIVFLCWGFVFVAPKLIPNASWLSFLSVTKRNLLLPTGLYIVTLLCVALTQMTSIQSKNRFALPLVLFAISLLDLFYFFHKITPFAPTDYFYPNTTLLSHIKSVQAIDRTWGYGSAYLDTNSQTYEKIFSTDGYDPLHIKWYGELVAASKNGRVPSVIPRSDANIASGYGNTDLANNQYRQKALNLLGVKYVVNKVGSSNEPADYETFPSNTYTLLWKNDVWQVYENKDALPRLSLIGSYLVQPHTSLVVSKLLEPAFDMRNTAILETNLPNTLSLRPDPSAKVKLLSYAPNEVSVRTNVKTNMLLLFTDTFAPGWQASVDSQHATIYRADYAFRAVIAPKGAHTIEFSYNPKSFTIGFLISSLALIGTACYGFFLKRHIRA